MTPLTSAGAQTHGLEESGQSNNRTNNSGGVQTPPRRTTAQVNTPPPVSQHATSVRQRDRDSEQKALYEQQYLTRSPVPLPEAQSLIQVSPASPRQGIVPLGCASATFKTLLLNSSTTSEELVKQAIQRFRLPAGDDMADYFLTIKRLGGSSASVALRPEERPLVVFETLADAALALPKVKRSSVGSISSIASNMSQHPAIKRLPNTPLSNGCR